MRDAIDTCVRYWENSHQDVRIYYDVDDVLSFQLKILMELKTDKTKRSMATMFLSDLIGIDIIQMGYKIFDVLNTCRNNLFKKEDDRV